MKTLKNVNTGEIRRVKDYPAINMVDSGEWEYIPKRKWKETVRGPIKKK